MRSPAPRKEHPMHQNRLTVKCWESGDLGVMVGNKLVLR